MINVGETVRVAVRPFDWDGEFDEGSICTFTVQTEDGTSNAQPMPFSEGQSAFVGTFVPLVSGTHNVRVTAVLTDGTKSVERRKIEVKS